MINIKSRRGVAPIVIIGIALAIILLIYILLFIPIPAFTKLRQTINYYLIVSLWIIIQVGVVYGFYKVAMYLKNGIAVYKRSILNFDARIKDFILTH